MISLLFAGSWVSFLSLGVEWRGVEGEGWRVEGDETNNLCHGKLLYLLNLDCKKEEKEIKIKFILVTERDFLLIETANQ